VTPYFPDDVDEEGLEPSHHESVMAIAHDVIRREAEILDRLAMARPDNFEAGAYFP
jgi:hypothetical protein